MEIYRLRVPLIVLLVIIIVYRGIFKVKLGSFLLSIELVEAMMKSNCTEQYTLRYISPVSPLCYDGLRWPPNKANAG